MHTGDTVRDDHGGTYEVGRLLGRGSWGSTYAARHAQSGASVVIKVPLTASQLGGNEQLARACIDILGEQASLAEGNTHRAIPPLKARLLVQGAPALVFPACGVPLTERATNGLSTADFLDLTIQAIRVLEEYSKGSHFHGNLTANNVLVDDRGRVYLTDPVTPTFRRYQAELYALAGTPGTQLAPELRGLAAPLPLSTPADTWAISLQLTRALILGQERLGSLPLDGMEKAHRVALKDQVLNRLRKEPSNPGFHSRLVDKLVALLNRALSRETSPSPPYRFRSLDEMAQRLKEIRALVHPTIVSIGKLNWGLRAGADAFLTDEEVRFTINVACSSGVEGRDEISTGIALFDRETGERIREIACSYAVDRHPSGRFRFQFKFPDLRPGLFRVRVAFTIRDSGDEPNTVEGEFNVRPAAGYVPPPMQPSRAPLPLEREPDEPVTKVTEPGVKIEPPSRTSRVVRPADGRLQGRDPISVDEEAPTQAVEPTLPTPIAPHRPANLAQVAPPSPKPAVVVEPPTTRREPVVAPPRTDTPSTARPGGRLAPPTRAPEPTRPSPREDARVEPPSAPIQPPTARPKGPNVSVPASAEVTADPPSNKRNQPAERSTTPPAPRGRPQPSQRREGATLPVAASIQPSEPPGPADLPSVDPSFPVMGTWVDLDIQEPTTTLDPSASSPGRSADARRPSPSSAAVEEDEDIGPIGEAISRMFGLVRSDAYYMFIAVAVVLIIILGIALVLVQPPV